jgi:hypothetical protein
VGSRRIDPSRAGVSQVQEHDQVHSQNQDGVGEPQPEANGYPVEEDEQEEGKAELPEMFGGRPSHDATSRAAITSSRSDSQMA